MKMMVDTECHRLHLIALIRRERDVAYRRHHYLSSEWRTDLAWREHTGAEKTMPTSPSSAEEGPKTRRRLGSPLSVMTPPASPFSTRSSPSYIVGGGPEVVSETKCIRRRDRIVEWMYQVVDRLDLNREIVGISTFYLDQYLSKEHVHDDEVFQLTAMASLYLAIKLHSPRKVSIRAIASTGNGAITIWHIEAMELSIMRRLDWHLFPPTSVAFIENFYPLIVSPPQRDDYNVDDDVVVIEDRGSRSWRGAIEDSLEFSRFLAELSVCSYPCVVMCPSSIAIASILLSFEYFGVPVETRDKFLSSVEGLAMSIDADSPEVEACVGLLRRMYALAMPSDSSWEDERRHQQSSAHTR
ncbi:hypothetical protein ACHAXA_008061 [Cyclostephanos tholiformis]|uniref:Cyclin-like domain-containing protein n=1 Tax=Cyclostephanos tholiformis TaxID=382380 RepID=A0ABD3RDR5_9STRA